MQCKDTASLLDTGDVIHNPQTGTRPNINCSHPLVGKAYYSGCMSAMLPGRPWGMRTARAPGDAADTPPGQCTQAFTQCGTQWLSPAPPAHWARLTGPDGTQCAAMQAHCLLQLIQQSRSPRWRNPAAELHPSAVGMGCLPGMHGTEQWLTTCSTVNWLCSPLLGYYHTHSSASTSW